MTITIIIIIRAFLNINTRRYLKRTVIYVILIAIAVIGIIIIIITTTTTTIIIIVVVVFGEWAITYR